MKRLIIIHKSSKIIKINMKTIKRLAKASTKPGQVKFSVFLLYFKDSTIFKNQNFNYLPIFSICFPKALNSNVSPLSNSEVLFLSVSKTFLTFTLSSLSEF